ncbi:type VII toxin-antitoxin system MntA family adenylyltransferase antitoxin [Methanoculleus bourgensis]|jgi:predicted nucleotidyltransferase|uniref:type VII toxin-antitoxin system MntA family adenylyltransferase antitoxin n=1 Tax=Methanoculleus bourgensis TaxID=83986 RepID=UPI002025611E|nr:nucleotidyltransferase domain-containing protein [Methanoculleus bourgensis]MDD3372877.1 nucleotidyltransferase domain-containing protein [Methanoculleus bourgensis]
MDKGIFGMRRAERDVRHALERLKTVEGFDKVRFIILYGSVAQGRARAESDIDLAVYYDGDHKEGARFRFAALSELADDRYDIQIFSHLPLYARTEVLHGRVVYCPDERFLYDIAYRTIREFDDFKHRLYDYIGKEAMA